MNLSPDVVNILLYTVIPGVITFLAGHFHLVLPSPASKTPTTIRPIGQGGLMDIGASLLAQIFASGASNDAKLAAAQKVVDAQNILVAPAAK